MKTAVVIPARNEEADIAEAVRQATSDTTKVIVVDGASTDKTVERAKEAGAWAVTKSAGATYGDAVLSGMEAALSMGVECVVVMDVGSHKFSDLTRSFSWFVPEHWDILAGYRMTGDKPFVRKVLSKLAACVVRTPIVDASNGFRAYKAHVARELVDHFGKKVPPSYAFNMAIASHSNVRSGKWRVREFLMEYKPGASGLTTREALKVLMWRLGWYR